MSDSKTPAELAVETRQEMIAFATTLREGTEDDVRAAFQAAASRKAVSEERYKETTLAAAFLFDYTAIVAKRPRYSEEKKRLFADLVLHEEGLATLRKLNKLGGQAFRIVELLGPFTSHSKEELEEIVRRATAR
jgi:hypothetical protein